MSFQHDTIFGILTTTVSSIALFYANSNIYVSSFQYVGSGKLRMCRMCKIICPSWVN